MGHIINSVSGRPRHERTIHRRYACAKVEVVSVRPPVLRVCDGVQFINLDTLMLQLPETVSVHASDGTVITGAFWITSETFDPFHLIVDALDGASPFAPAPSRDGKA